VAVRRATGHATTTQEAAQVMPFDLSATTHTFLKSGST
jgi:hypothetical protein